MGTIFLNSSYSRLWYHGMINLASISAWKRTRPINIASQGSRPIWHTVSLYNKALALKSNILLFVQIVDRTLGIMYSRTKTLIHLDTCGWSNSLTKLLLCAEFLIFQRPPHINAFSTCTIGVWDPFCAWEWKWKGIKIQQQTKGRKAKQGRKNQLVCSIGLFDLIWTCLAAVLDMI